jgi:hypothetical protein
MMNKRLAVPNVTPNFALKRTGFGVRCAWSLVASRPGTLWPKVTDPSEELHNCANEMDPTFFPHEPHSRQNGWC